MIKTLVLIIALGFTGVCYSADYTPVAKKVDYCPTKCGCDCGKGGKCNCDPCLCKDCKCENCPGKKQAAPKKADPRPFVCPNGTCPAAPPTLIPSACPGGSCYPAPAGRGRIIRR